MAYDVEKNMTNHAPASPEVVKKYEAIRESCKMFASLVEELCPDSREKSLAFTNLEQALMWSIASIARNANV